MDISPMGNFRYTKEPVQSCLWHCPCGALGLSNNCNSSHSNLHLKTENLQVNGSQCQEVDWWLMSQSRCFPACFGCTDFNGFEANKFAYIIFCEDVFRLWLGHMVQHVDYVSACIQWMQQQETMVHFTFQEVALHQGRSLQQQELNPA